MTTDEIVIATLDCEKALYVIAKSAVTYDQIEIHYMDKYAPTIEYLLRILRKGFGWVEVERGEKDVENTKCAFNEHGGCNKIKEVQRCTEQVRVNCKQYTKKFNRKFKVNMILIEKLGAIRNM